jgi:hypothetical protein
VVKQMARYTGLSETFIENCDLRVELGKFNKELLRDQKRTTGRLAVVSPALIRAPPARAELIEIRGDRSPYTAFNDYETRSGIQERFGHHPRRRFHLALELNADNTYADTASR